MSDMPEMIDRALDQSKETIHRDIYICHYFCIIPDKHGAPGIMARVGLSGCGGGVAIFSVWSPIARGQACLWAWRALLDNPTIVYIAIQKMGGKFPIPLGGLAGF